MNYGKTNICILAFERANSSEFVAYKEVLPHGRSNDADFTMTVGRVADANIPNNFDGQLLNIMSRWPQNHIGASGLQNSRPRHQNAASEAYWVKQCLLAHVWGRRSLSQEGEVARVILRIQGSETVKPIEKPALKHGQMAGQVITPSEQNQFRLALTMSRLRRKISFATQQSNHEG